MADDYHFADLAPETQEAVRAKLRAAQLGRRHTADRRRKNGLAHRKSETRPCHWCGNAITRVPSLFRGRTVSYCGVACSNTARHWFRRFPDTARPLLVQRLRDTATGTRATYTDLERLGRPFGVGEAEILAALTDA